jgi:glyoxylate/hydroxypyruvate reductase A
MTKIMVKVGGGRAEPYTNALRALDPSLVFEQWPDISDPDDIDIAMVWQMPLGELQKFKNLKMVISMAAGVDHVLRDKTLPPQVEITRVVDPHMARAMTHYVVMSVLRLHRESDPYDRLRAAREWSPSRSFDADAVQIGLLGLGHLGQAAGQGLRALGFNVRGWSSSPKNIEGIESFHGADGLSAMLRQTNCLCCLLPLTADTHGILGAATFDQMPDGSFLVNSGRGEHLVEADLIAALDSGRIRMAALDVFSTEPLPQDHSFWGDERIVLTPHTAAEVHIPSVTKGFLENIRRCRDGQPLIGAVDRTKGY